MCPLQKFYMCNKVLIVNTVSTAGPKNLSSSVSSCNFIHIYQQLVSRPSLWQHHLTFCLCGVQLLSIPRVSFYREVIIESNFIKIYMHVIFVQKRQIEWTLCSTFEDWSISCASEQVYFSRTLNLCVKYLFVCYLITFHISSLFTRSLTCIIDISGGTMLISNSVV